MPNKMHDRNIRFFGKEGQDHLASVSVAVVGIGGLGTHVVQQLALLGVGRLVLIDDEEVNDTNRNRYIGLRHDDPVPGTLKVVVGERIVHDINPKIGTHTIPKPLASRSAYKGVIDCDYVFGCVDNEGARLILTELSAAYSKPYFDLASDINIDHGHYGGRVCVAWNGDGCLYCYRILDRREASDDLRNLEARHNQQKIYGISKDALSEAGPSVVSINGVVASLGVNEFMLAVTKVHEEPRKLLKYYAHRGGVTVSKDRPNSEECPFCRDKRGKGQASEVWRYLE